MPMQQAVEAFTSDVLSNDHAGAIERWYAEDASIQENQDEPRAGRDTLVAGERRVLAGMARVQTELLAPPLVDGDRVAIRWRFTFERADGAQMTMEEVAWQTWRDGKIWHEIFYYDPRQRVFQRPA